MSNYNNNNNNSNDASQTPFSFQFVNENEQFDTTSPGPFREGGIPSTASQPSRPSQPAPSSTGQEENSTQPYDIQSQWVIFELFKTRYVRLETTSSIAAKERLYEEIHTLYNSSPNVNGRRNLRSIKSKWSEMLRTYRRRKDQQSLTGTAPQAVWAFHDEMDSLVSDIPTAVPPTVYSSMMPQGETEDNRRERVPRNTSARSTRLQTSNDFSIEALLEGQKELMDGYFERTRPQRELVDRFLEDTMRSNAQYFDYMESLTSSRNVMLEIMQGQREDSRQQMDHFDRVSASLRGEMRTLLEKNNNRQSVHLPSPSPSRFPSSNESSRGHNESSRANKRRRMSL
jgi:hypothetical protein